VVVHILKRRVARAEYPPDEPKEAGKCTQVRVSSNYEHDGESEMGAMPMSARLCCRSRRLRRDTTQPHACVTIWCQPESTVAGSEPSASAFLPLETVRQSRSRVMAEQVRALSSGGRVAENCSVPVTR
jgi:hypothetical protein